ncbi:MAG: enoyl-CoA hydratase/isomerase family protein [Actinomycetes bacterium]
MTATLTTTNPVWTLDLGEDESRFSLDWLSQVEQALATVRESSEPVALCITATGKFFSNGLDLDWLQANPGEWAPYVGRVQAVFSQTLTLPVPTVCAINGHCFAAGAMLALACDYRVMRTERGFFCLPEVDINIPFSVGMSALIQSKLTPRNAFDSMATGRRYDANAALEAGIVDAVCDVERLTDVANGIVADLAGKDRKTLGTIKSVMYADVVTALGEPIT